MVTMRSLGLMNADSAFSSVVLPAPVPPAMMMFSFALTAASSSSSMPGVIALRSTRSAPISLSCEKRRMDISGPSIASGGMIALTRDPSAETGVHHRGRFVHAPADLRNDLVDDPEQVPVVAECDAGQFELTFALDVDLPVAVDQDVRDGRVLKQRLQRPETENFVQNLIGDLLLLE